MVKDNNYAHTGENPEHRASGNKKTALEGGLGARLWAGASSVKFALGGFVVVVLQAVLVAHDLAVHFIDQLIHRSIQIGVGTFRKQVTALHMDIAFSALPLLLFLLLLYRQQHLDIHHLVKMSGDPIEFGGDVAAQGGGDFEVVTADRQVHK